jgi:hypothetical protein
MPYAESQFVDAQAAKLEGLLQSAVTAIVIIDTAGIIENVNPATARMMYSEAWPSMRPRSTRS